MLVQVDACRSGADASEGGFLHCGGIAYKSYHGAVMVGIAADIQQMHAIDLGDSVPDRVDFCCIAAFAKVRDTFDHTSLSFAAVALRCAWAGVLPLAKSSKSRRVISSPLYRL